MILVDELVSREGNYVGQTRRAEQRGEKDGHLWCRMTSSADDVDFRELHAFADRLHVLRTWFQEDFYWLTARRRRKAVNRGALEVPRKVLSEVLQCGRQR